MIKQIIKNEIKDVLGHEATDAEYKSCIEYLQEWISEKSMMVDVELAIRDWRNDFCHQCWWSGEYFLPDEMEYDHFCTEQDKAQWEENECAYMEHKKELQSRWNER